MEIKPELGYLSAIERTRNGGNLASSMAWKLDVIEQMQVRGRDVASMAWGARNSMSTHRRERHECHCMLFLTDDNEFAGDNKVLTLQETKDLTDEM